MPRYAIANVDGSVSIMQTIPISLVDGDITHSIGGFYTNGTLRLITEIGDLDTGVSDLDELNADTLSPLRIVFADAAGCLAKWPFDVLGDVIGDPIEIAPSAIPEDRTFRQAWTFDGKSIVTDMDKAREIKRDILRVERAPLLDALDVEYQKADEADDKDKKAAIAAKRQALRDVTKDAAIDAANTPEELKAVRPAALDVSAEVVSIK